MNNTLLRKRNKVKVFSLINSMIYYETTTTIIIGIKQY